MRKRKGIIAAAALAATLAAGGCRREEAVFTSLIGEQTGLYEAGQTESSEAEQPCTARPAASEKAENESTENAGAPERDEGCIHVCGAVNTPGVYPFRDGMRLFEAVALAGGFAPDADEDWQNQAQPLQDGQRLYIYTLEETKALSEAQPDGAQAAGAFAADAQAQPDAKVNINTADKAALMSLPGIGESRAEAILQYRTEHGGFSAVEEIQEISGIKNAVYSKIKDRITV